MRRSPIIAVALLMLAACGGGSTAAPTPELDPAAAQGLGVFNRNCAACHALSPDTVIVGPSLARIAARASDRLPDLDARAYVEMSILKPSAYIVQGFSDVMPKDFGKKLTGEELDALVAFLLTLQ